MMILELRYKLSNVSRLIRSKDIDLAFEPHHILISYTDQSGNEIVEGILATEIETFKLKEE